MKPDIIRNALMTPDGTVIESFHRHDYVSHTDANGKTYMVDGGLSYLRRSAHEDGTDLSLYSNETHSVQREALTWGTYGKHGDQPIKRKKIKDMSDKHIEAVLLECNPARALVTCMQTELEDREAGVYDMVED